MILFMCKIWYWLLGYFVKDLFTEEDAKIADALYEDQKWI